jgi:hypothetical protein
MSLEGEGDHHEDGGAHGDVIDDVHNGRDDVRICLEKMTLEVVYLRLLSHTAISYTLF